MKMRCLLTPCTSLNSFRLSALYRFNHSLHNNSSSLSPDAVQRIARSIVGACLQHAKTHRRMMGKTTRSLEVRRLSSLLPDDTLECLSQRQGVAAFCRELERNRERICVDGSEYTFALTTVNGIPVLQTTSLDTRESMGRGGSDIEELLPPHPISTSLLAARWKCNCADEAVDKLYTLLDKRVSWRRAVNNALGPTDPHADVAESWDPSVEVYSDQDGHARFARRVVPPRLLRASSSPLPEGWSLSDLPAPYDAWRLAALLKVKEPTPLSTVGALSASVTEFDPFWVALAFPDRFQLHYEDNAAEASNLGSSSTVASSVSYRRVLSRGNFSPRRIVGLSFVLNENERAVLTPSPVLAGKTEEELEAFIDRKRSSGLQTRRKRVVRERLRRRYPDGNPFLCADVVAMRIYDGMEPRRWYNSNEIRETLLPNRGRDTLHMGTRFCATFPSLFVVRFDNSVMSHVMKRDQLLMGTTGDEGSATPAQEETGELRRPSIPAAKMTDDELLWEVLGFHFRHKANGTTLYSYSSFVAFVPAHWRQQVRSDSFKNTFIRFVEQHPEAFVVRQGSQDETLTEGDQKEKTELLFTVNEEALKSLLAQSFGKVQ